MIDQNNEEAMKSQNERDKKVTRDSGFWKLLYTSEPKAMLWDEVAD